MRCHEAIDGKPTTVVICHGAWSAGWCWKKMRPLWHNPPQSYLFTPTLTGVGERAHLGLPTTDLNSHIDDILAVIRMEDLQDIILIGHSYGGMVATPVYGSPVVAGRSAYGTLRAYVPGQPVRNTLRFAVP